MPPILITFVLLVEQHDDRVRRVAVELGGVGVGQAHDVAGELDHRALQAQADAEERHLVLAGEADRLDLAVDAALVEAAGHEHAVDPAQRMFCAPRAPTSSASTLLTIELGVEWRCRRGQRLVDRLVGVVVLDVLADDRDRHLVGRVA